MRFIPAGAGNRIATVVQLCENTVHPRWRGEQAYLIPRNKSVVRFIPAGAGNRRMDADFR